MYRSVCPGMESSSPPLRPELLEKLQSGGCYANARVAVRVLDANQPMVVGILPNRKPRTRSAPSVHRFFIGALLTGNPLHEIQDKSFNGLNHITHFNGF